jgi:hypothetical protein
MTVPTGGPSAEGPDEPGKRPVGKRERSVPSGGRVLGGQPDDQAPPSVNTAFGLWLVAVICGLIVVIRSEIALGWIGLALWVGLAFSMWFGKNWARIGLTVLGVASVVLNVVVLAPYAGDDDGLPPLVVLLTVAQVSSVVGAIVKQYTAESNQFFARSTEDWDDDEDEDGD